MQVKKWLLRFSVTGIFILGILVAIILNPNITYSNTTTHGDYTIFHNKEINKELFKCVDEAKKTLQKSELYDAGLKIDICLNDGSKYPDLISRVGGRAFARGFYNKIVFMSNVDHANNFAELNGYKWNLQELVVHELIHCYQFNKFGLLRSNPLARIPEWKWEGYPEYVARSGHELKKNITQLVNTEKTDNNGWIQFNDNTGTVIPYYKYWLLMQYCMDIKKMTYAQILKDTTREETVREEMMRWYSGQ